MSSKNRKLSALLRQWPPGTCATQSWLSQQGIYYQLAEKYVQGGWIEKIGNAAFKRAGDKVDWRGGVFAIQHGIETPIHVGGLTSLDLTGQSHYLYLGKPHLQLFNTEKKHPPRLLPKWFTTYFAAQMQIHYIRSPLFPNDTGLRDFSCHHFTIKISTTERALLEILSLVPKKMTFEHAYHLISNKYNLQADLLTELLNLCKSHQTKRLFLYFAKRCELPCLEKLNMNKITLGTGKRTVATEGESEYDPDLKLEVPKCHLDTDNNDDEILF